jgi:hypothetical protein
VTAKKKNSIDYRPFRSRAEHLLEKHLEVQYRGVAIPALVAALTPRKERADGARTVEFAPAG